jgi:hypothetical protein
MYRYQTVGSVIDNWLAGYPADVSDLSDYHKQLVNEFIEMVVSRSPRRSARID